MSQATVSNVCSYCKDDLCAKCSLCTNCVPGHEDGYGGELYFVIDMLDSLLDTHGGSPSPQHAVITALLEQADSTLRTVMRITGHQRA